MDSNMKDESPNRRREEALARRLGEALDKASVLATETCPDAELIAAYHERELGPEEAARCETHFAACSRCRKILAVLAASAETPLAEIEVARLGELVAAARAPLELASQPDIPARPKLYWRARWLAPALGVAAVLALWFAIRPPWRPVDQGSSGTLIAQAPQNESLPPAAAPPVDQFSNAAPTKQLKADATTPSRILKGQAAGKTESATSAAETLAKKSLDDARATDRLAPKAKVAESAPADEKKEQADVKSAMAATPAPAPPQRPAALGGPPAQAQAAPAAPEAPGSAAQTVTVTGAASAVATAGAVAGNAPPRDRQALAGQRGVSELPANGRNLQSLTTIQAGREPFIVSSMPSVTAIGGPGPALTLWRAGKGGSIELSDDTGRTWRPQASPLREDWLSGAAVSKTICWLVGRNGSIARTPDGEHWERIAPPPMSADASGKLPDWINVTASNAQTATITASDQRLYTTQDGGITWRAQ
jgi:hypothetical protein